MLEGRKCQANRISRPVPGKEDIRSYYQSKVIKGNLMTGFFSMCHRLLRSFNGSAAVFDYISSRSKILITLQIS